MKIKSHWESHTVELDDGSQWQIFPGDLEVTLNWTPETDFAVMPSDDDISTHRLVDGGAKVHVIAAGESWPVKGGQVDPEGRIAWFVIRPLPLHLVQELG